MQEMLSNPTPQAGKPKTSAISRVMGTAVVLAVALGLWFFFGPSQSKRNVVLTESMKLKMGAAEQEYTKNIQVEGIALSRAENFLHQEVTILNVEVVNGGTLPVAELLLTAEFADDLNQVVLRETRRVLRAPARALAPGERRSFEISFDHVPRSWNMQQPMVRVSYLRLPTGK